jgi:uncharacterized protein (TIGR02594 family)
MDTREVQTLLVKHGFDPGKIDGIPGPKTSAAIIRFKVSKGLAPRDYVGPITIGELRKDPGSKSIAPPAVSGEPVWLRRARQEIGVSEISGPRHSARVLSYWEKAKLYFDDDETPWCAGFVCAMLEDCGIKSPRSGMARSFQHWGQPCGPIKGAIVVYWRGSKSGSSGHVGFVTGKDQYGNIMTLGGNQSDAVNVKPFDDGRVLAYRWPAGVPIGGGIEVVESDGKTSANEA